MSSFTCRLHFRLAPAFELHQEANTLLSRHTKLLCISSTTRLLKSVLVKFGLTVRSQIWNRSLKWHRPIFRRPHMASFMKAQRLLQEKGQRLPRLVVLDLDYTLWPLWCDMYTKRDTDVAQLFPEAKQILDALRDSNIKLAVASRSPTPDVAKAFLQKVGISSGYFDRLVIVPYINKDQHHFPELRRTFGIDYEDMLFFDDEQLQYRVVSKLGVTSVLVSTSSGLCLQSFSKGLDQFAKKQS